MHINLYTSMLTYNVLYIFQHYMCSNVFGLNHSSFQSTLQRHTCFPLPPSTVLQLSPFSAVAPLLRIWMARRMSRLNRATAAARSHSRSCSSDRRNISTSMSGPRLIQPHSRRARQRSSLRYRGTSVCRSEPLQHLRLSVVPGGTRTFNKLILYVAMYYQCRITQTLIMFTNTI